jgi:hypothetical protein
MFQRSGGNPAGLVVAPILRQLIMNREPEVVLDWIERIAGVGGTYGGVSKGGGSTKGSKVRPKLFFWRDAPVLQLAYIFILCSRELKT